MTEVYISDIAYLCIILLIPQKQMENALWIQIVCLQQSICLPLQRHPRKYLLIQGSIVTGIFRATVWVGLQQLTKARMGHLSSMSQTQK